MISGSASIENLIDADLMIDTSMCELSPRADRTRSSCCTVSQRLTMGSASQLVEQLCGTPAIAARKPSTSASNSSIFAFIWDSRQQYEAAAAVCNSSGSGSSCAGQQQQQWQWQQSMAAGRGSSRWQQGEGALRGCNLVEGIVQGQKHMPLQHKCSFLTAHSA